LKLGGRLLATMVKPVMFQDYCRVMSKPLLLVTEKNVPQPMEAAIRAEVPEV
jgi:hypothetical protein